MTKDIEIINAHVWAWTIPYFGNKHYCPYGKIHVTAKVDGVLKEYICNTRGDKYSDHIPYQYVVIEKQRFIVTNIGRLHAPIIKLRKWHKTFIGNRLMYV